MVNDYYPTFHRKENICCRSNHDSRQGRPTMLRLQTTGLFSSRAVVLLSTRITGTLPVATTKNHQRFVDKGPKCLIRQGSMPILFYSSLISDRYHHSSRTACINLNIRTSSESTYDSLLPRATSYHCHQTMSTRPPLQHNVP